MFFAPLSVLNFSSPLGRGKTLTRFGNNLASFRPGAPSRGERFDNLRAIQRAIMPLRAIGLDV
ncbi:MAG: hypothetical protein NTW86_33245, partial [Candidatus Sumerlaeota bacterium]|nr:hypothetical protein [Candidatus Sumerlaeota bacterium]